MDELKYPLVSIIMPAYNSQYTIKDTIQSVLKQTYPNWELLITDDLSSDSTPKIIKKFAAQDPRIKLYSNPVNSGAAVSRNNSLKNANGEFIAFLDSDDLWEASKLEKQILWMLKNPNITFSFTAYQLIDEHGNKLKKIIDFQGDNVSFGYHDMLFKKATLGCSTVILKKDAFDDIKMPLIRTGQDYALWLKLLKSCERCYLYNEVLTQYRVMPNSISRNKIKKAKRQWEIYRKIEGLPLVYSVICFISYGWRAIFRR
ncbi:glycosyltransferase family 2 protein [Escherichia coli]|uniref:glycosyltransferase family 2 protein n=1 Tax=Escherichia coli TaxID=562 RepID=UPI002551287A|nr:glycosyltransferase [Escherichia coli]HDN3181726.1 glycosyltransferase [Escherichia coli]HDQ1524054.1 glycosyltransferase [Escherichia coli]